MHSSVWSSRDKGTTVWNLRWRELGIAVLLEEALEHVMVAYFKLTTGDTGMIYTENGIDILHTLCSNICQLLNLGSGIFDLRGRLGWSRGTDAVKTYLVVCQLQLELLDTTLDGIPAGQAMAIKHETGAYLK
jgi:hypothetical protein